MIFLARPTATHSHTRIHYMLWVLEPQWVVDTCRCMPTCPSSGGNHHPQPFNQSNEIKLLAQPPALCSPTALTGGLGCGNAGAAHLPSYISPFLHSLSFPLPSPAPSSLRTAAVCLLLDVTPPRTRASSTQFALLISHISVSEHWRTSSGLFGALEIIVRPVIIRSAPHAVRRRLTVKSYI